MTKKERATKKVQIAIDKILDIMDMNLDIGGTDISAALDKLRAVETRIEHFVKD